MGDRTIRRDTTEPVSSRGNPRSRCMLLKLERPIVFLDFETTGLYTKNDRILELAFIRLLPDGTRE